MKKFILLLSLVLILTGCGQKIEGASQNNNNVSTSTPIEVRIIRVGPDYLYPNKLLTPGKADTLSIEDLTKRYNGKTYSQAHRKVKASDHKKVYETYQVNPTARNIKFGEVDHFYPLCAGGSNDITNLWYQPKEAKWNGQDFGFKAKDKLEAFICRQIKAKKLDPVEAFKCVVDDWVACFIKYKSQLTNNTSVYSIGGAVE